MEKNLKSETLVIAKESKISWTTKQS